MRTLYPPIEPEYIGKTFDDFLIRPRYGVVYHRNVIHLPTPLIMSSGMKHVTGSRLATEMYRHKGLGFIHRRQTIEEQVAEVKKVKDGVGSTVGAYIGATGDYLERTMALKSAGVDFICMDVAHAHSCVVKVAIEAFKDEFPMTKLWVGNVATYEGAKNLVEWGADGIKVGIGNGSICRTRLATGVGVPQAQAIREVYAAAKGKAFILADGGMRTTKDIMLALMLGANSVILGSIFAGTNESLATSDMNGHKSYYGETADDEYPEGQMILVPQTGPAGKVIDTIHAHIRSAISYMGFNSFNMMQQYVVENPLLYLTPLSSAASRESYVRPEISA